MNFHSVLDVCFCLLPQLRQFMTLLKYLWQQHLKADRLMISMFVAGFISLIWNSSHDVRIRLSVHLCCYLWRRSPGDIDYFWQAGCLMGFFCCPFWQCYRNLPMKHCINQKKRNLLPARCFAALICLCLQRRYYRLSWISQCIIFTLCCSSIESSCRRSYPKMAALSLSPSLQVFLTFTFFLCLSQQSFLSRRPQDINAKLQYEAFPFFWPLERLSSPAAPLCKYHVVETKVPQWI